MRSILQSLTLAAVAALLLVGTHAQAGPVFNTTSGTYKFSGTNFPTNFSDSGLALDGSLKPANGGQLTVREIFTPEGADSEWIQFVISKPSGPTLAGNVNANWSVAFDDITYLQPSSFTGFFLSFTSGGVPDTTINPIGGLGVITNPISGIGNVFGNLFPGNTALFPDLDGAFAFINPFSFLNSGGVNVSQIDGLIVGVRGTRPATPQVPEPTSMALFGLGSLGLGAVMRRHRNAKL